MLILHVLTCTIGSRVTFYLLILCLAGHTLRFFKPRLVSIERELDYIIKRFSRAAHFRILQLGLLGGARMSGGGGGNRKDDGLTNPLYACLEVLESVRCNF